MNYEICNVFVNIRLRGATLHYKRTEFQVVPKYSIVI